MTDRAIRIELVRARDLVPGDVVALDHAPYASQRIPRLLPAFVDARWVVVDGVDTTDAGETSIAIGEVTCQLGPLDLVRVQVPETATP